MYERSNSNDGFERTMSIIAIGVPSSQPTGETGVTMGNTLSIIELTMCVRLASSPHAVCNARKRRNSRAEIDVLPPSVGTPVLRCCGI